MTGRMKKSIKSLSVLLLVCFTLTLADEYHGSAVRSRHRRAALTTVPPTQAADNEIPSQGEALQQDPEYIAEEEPCEDDLRNQLEQNRTKKKACSLDGIWYNSLGSEMILNVSADGLLMGEYRTAVEKGWGSAGEGHSIIVGHSKPGPNPSFGLTVIWNEGESVTSWTGQCLMCDGTESLRTTWVMSSKIDSCRHEWLSDRIGQDTFTREEQRQGPRKALNTHTPRDFWRTNTGL